MADSSPLAGVLAQAAQVFSLAGALGRAFQEEREARQAAPTDLGPCGWRHHEAKFDSFWVALMHLDHVIKNPPDGFAPVVEPLRKAARITNEIRSARLRDRRTLDYQDYYPDLNTIAIYGSEAVSGVAKSRGLNQSFANADEESPSLSITQSDRFPPTRSGHLEFIEWVRDEIHYAAQAKREQLARGYGNATIEAMLRGIKWSEAATRIVGLASLPIEAVAQVARLLGRKLTLGTVEQIDELLGPAVQGLREAWEKAQLYTALESDIRGDIRIPYDSKIMEAHAQRIERDQAKVKSALFTVYREAIPWFWPAMEAAGYLNDERSDAVCRVWNRADRDWAELTGTPAPHDPDGWHVAAVKAGYSPAEIPKLNFLDVAPSLRSWAIAIMRTRERSAQMQSAGMGTTEVVSEPDAGTPTDVKGTIPQHPDRLPTQQQLSEMDAGTVLKPTSPVEIPRTDDLLTTDDLSHLAGVGRRRFLNVLSEARTGRDCSLPNPRVRGSGSRQDQYGYAEILAFLKRTWPNRDSAGYFPEEFGDVQRILAARQQ